MAKGLQVYLLPPNKNADATADSNEDSADKSKDQDSDEDDDKYEDAPGEVSPHWETARAMSMRISLRQRNTRAVYAGAGIEDRDGEDT